MRTALMLASTAALVVLLTNAAQAVVTSTDHVSPSLSGSTSQLTVDLRIGYEATNVNVEDVDPRVGVTVTEGDSIAFDQVIVGEDLGFLARLEVSGAGSTVEVDHSSTSGNGALVVAEAGDGYASFSDGAILKFQNDLGDLVIAENATSFGEMVFTSGAFANLTDDIVVGEAGLGLLTVSDGALLRTNNAVSSVVTLGLDAGSAGYMTVTGAQTLAQLAGDLTVGGAGVGELVISHGGRVDADRAGSQASVGGLGKIYLNNGTLEVLDVNVDGYLGGHGIVRGQVDVSSTGSVEVNAGQELEIQGAFSNTGSITVTEGEARFSSTASTLVGGSLTLEDGTVRFGPVTGTADYTNGGVIASAAGANNLHGRITNTGTTVVARDTVAVFHDAYTDTGTTTVLSGGNALFLSNVVFTNILNLEFQEVDGVMEYSQLYVGGDATLGGSLAIDIPDSIVPEANTTYELLSIEGDVTGQFVPPVFPFIEGVDFNLEYTSDAVLLNVLLVSVEDVPGDFNNDGIVNGQDYAIWREDYQNGARPASDFDLWKANYGATVSSAPLPSAPEPSTTGLLLLAAACWGRLPRQKRAS